MGNSLVYKYYTCMCVILPPLKRKKQLMLPSGPQPGVGTAHHNNGLYMFRTHWPDSLSISVGAAPDNTIKWIFLWKWDFLLALFTNWINSAQNFEEKKFTVRDITFL